MKRSFMHRVSWRLGGERVIRLLTHGPATGKMALLSPALSQGRGQSRSAGFQPAVSQCFQPANATNLSQASAHPVVCRLEIGDTAGWKPALLPYGQTLSLALSPLLPPMEKL